MSQTLPHTHCCQSWTSLPTMASQHTLAACTLPLGPCGSRHKPCIARHEPSVWGPECLIPASAAKGPGWRTVGRLRAPSAGPSAGAAEEIAQILQQAREDRWAALPRHAGTGRAPTARRLQLSYHPVPAPPTPFVPTPIVSAALAQAALQKADV